MTVTFSGCSGVSYNQSNSQKAVNLPSDNRQTVNPQADSRADLLVPTSITASKSGGPNALPSKASDNDLTTVWNSGGFAPQWIQFDLGEEKNVSKVRLNVSQEPTGRTVHEIYGGETSDSLRLLGTLDSITKENEWLELPIAGDKIRFLKFTTKISSGWVSWREIQIIK